VKDPDCPELDAAWKPAIAIRRVNVVPLPSSLEPDPAVVLVDGVRSPDDIADRVRGH
jgi:hypothetical protein